MKPVWFPVCVCVCFLTSRPTCLWSLGDIHTCSGPSRWCRWRCSRRAATHTRWCQTRSCSPGNRARRSSGTRPPRPYRWPRSDTGGTRTRPRPLRSAALRTPPHTHTQSPRGAVCRCRRSGRARPRSLWRAFRSRLRRTRADTCRSSRWADPRRGTAVRHTGRSRIRLCPRCSCRRLTRPGTRSGTAPCPVCWCSRRRGWKGKRRRARHSACPCSGPRPWGRGRRSRPCCPRRWQRCGRVRTSTCPRWRCRISLKHTGREGNQLDVGHYYYC